MKKKTKSIPLSMNYSRVKLSVRVISNLTNFIFERTQQTRFSLLFRNIYPYTEKSYYMIDNHEHSYRLLYDQEKQWQRDFPIVLVPTNTDELKDSFSKKFNVCEGKYGFKLGISFIINTRDGYECMLSLSNHQENITSCQITLCNIHYFSIYKEIMNYCTKHHGFSTFFPTVEKISTIEKIILTFIADGLSSIEISKKMFVTESTVNFHIYNVIKKLRCKNQKQAIAKSIILGII